MLQKTRAYLAVFSSVNFSVSELKVLDRAGVLRARVVTSFKMNKNYNYIYGYCSIACVRWYCL